MSQPAKVVWIEIPLYKEKAPELSHNLRRSCGLKIAGDHMGHIPAVTTREGWDNRAM